MLFAFTVSVLPSSKDIIKVFPCLSPSLSFPRVVSPCVSRSGGSCDTSKKLVLVILHAIVAFGKKK